MPKMLPKGARKWPVEYVYGNFRKAISVAENLRKRGKECWVREARDGNCYVHVKPKGNDSRRTLR